MSMFGWDSKDPLKSSQTRQSPSPHQQVTDHSSPDPTTGASKEQSPPSRTKQIKEKDHSDFAIDPALRGDPIDRPASNAEALQNHPSEISMPHRVEPFTMSSSQRRHHFEHSHRLPSPPPTITAITHSHSPSPVGSLDRSSVSTPPVRRSPPQQQMQQQPTLYSSPYPSDPRHHHSSHFPSRGDMSHGGYMYPPHPPFEQRAYDQGSGNNSPYHSGQGVPAHFVPPMNQGSGPIRDYGHPYPIPGQPPVASVYTDDAATKLSDRVRRRCFNCCTTDTSTWRRSNLSPGKVLCNKCGLFERTHSRPRPDQFPHKRGPLATSALRGRTPPAQSQLPPISPPPYHYTHPPLAPMSSSQQQQQQQQQQGDGRRDFPSNTLPGLQSWHHGPESGSGSPHMQPPPLSSSSTSSGRRTAHDSSPHSRQPSPPQLARSTNSSQDSTSRQEQPAAQQQQQPTASTGLPRESV